MIEFSPIDQKRWNEVLEIISIRAVQNFTIFE